ncbi:hypothetical protein TVAG_063620 [Trichomonas vaginalis G3]|uniref:Uncharacterized protein n=1 Tax=Trichomonas vaginalis (strain ATCC PRA-98 / G3) TaxID=412133 RepID=A2EU32_TRIV3|nr:hypothetical protein TVAGG3_0954980 [Trichomonas vaginalis G3]EAY03849.1 hypothetical protein TVAG_063620 [Trichomonas vaginalis G3]KAI5487485.1 hypothetical protein TVAGG3_0954980 [Trichomonas vaginalis G3]|eukprot:XP_001316072.1 hypothetical protein [Trichomonas vaginalis G3]
MSLKNTPNSSKTNIVVINESGTTTPLLKTKRTSSQAQSKRDDTSQYDQIAQRLIDGGDVHEVNPSQVTDVMCALRRAKKNAENKSDYDTLRNIEKITADLQLASGASQYDSVQKEKIDNLKKKLSDVKSEYEKSRKKREQVYNSLMEEKIKAFQDLEKVQNAELDKLDKQYDQSEAPPPKFRKLSPELIQLKHIEEKLKGTGRYDQAVQLREEREALTEYELAVKRNEWYNEWRIQREKLTAKHDQQKQVLQERYEFKWARIEPEYEKKFSYFDKVISHLESSLRSQKALRKEAKDESKSIINQTQNRSLPELSSRSSSRSSALSRIITVSGTKTYTRPNTQARRH